MEESLLGLRNRRAHCKKGVRVFRIIPFLQTGMKNRRFYLQKVIRNMERSIFLKRQMNQYIVVRKFRNVHSWGGGSGREFSVGRGFMDIRMTVFSDMNGEQKCLL